MIRVSQESNGKVKGLVCSYCGDKFEYLNLVASGIELCDVCSYSNMDLGSKPIKGSPKPKYTMWKQKTVRNRVRNSLIRGAAGVAFGFGFFFSLFVVNVMSAAANVHSFWILLVPCLMISYGCYKLDSVDKFLRIHFGDK